MQNTVQIIKFRGAKNCNTKPCVGNYTVHVGIPAQFLNFGIMDFLYAQ